MKDIKTGTLVAIISMCSVVVMFIWGYIEGGYQHSWLAILIGGVISSAISMIRKDKENKDGKDN